MSAPRRSYSAILPHSDLLVGVCCGVRAPAKQRVVCDPTAEIVAALGVCAPTAADCRDSPHSFIGVSQRPNVDDNSKENRGSSSPMIQPIYGYLKFGCALASQTEQTGMHTHTVTRLVHNHSTWRARCSSVVWRVQGSLSWCPGGHPSVCAVAPIASRVFWRSAGHNRLLVDMQ